MPASIEVRSAAHAYVSRGFAVVPVPPGQKGPVLKGWQKLRLMAEELDAAFSGPSNIGVLLGDPSGGLVDVDLDCPEALELAEQFLPPTSAKTGRPSSPNSHRWYLAPGAKTRQFKDPATGAMIVELRSTGAQTLVGPSVHPEGEVYAALQGDPAPVDADDLASCVEALAKEVVRRRHPDLREETQRGPTSGDVVATGGTPRVLADPGEVERRAAAYLDAMEPSISGLGGHDRAFAAATALVHGFCLDPEAAFRMMTERFNPRCTPRWSEAELRHKIDDAATKPHSRPRGWLRDRPLGRSDGGLPEVVLGADEHRVIDEVVAALSRDDRIYQRGGLLVEVVTPVEPGEKGTPTIVPIEPARLREIITKNAVLQKYTKEGVEEAHPPAWLVMGAAARRELKGIRPLVSIAFAPVLRPDGSVVHTPGYDAATGVLLAPEGTFPAVPDDITETDVHAARDRIRDVAHDFPFESDAHRSGWMAAFLTPIARTAFEGPAPLCLIDANTRGAGKTMLVQVIARVVLGRDMATSTYTHDSAECRKQITTIAIAGEPLVLLDNLAGVIGNDALDRVLTTTRWRDRVLGSNTQADLPMRTTWFATGNNTAVAADTSRRVIYVRLETPLEHPEDRGGFRHPDLLGFAQAHRGSLYMDGLKILAGYIRAGFPNMGLRSMGSFSGWSNLVRSAVVWAGMPDPCSTRDGLELMADSSKEVLSTLLEAFEMFDPAGAGLVIADLLPVLYPAATPPDDPASQAMRSALEMLTDTRAGRTPGSRQVGAKLKAIRRQVVGGRMLDCDSTRCRGGKRWRIVRLSGGDGSRRISASGVSAAGEPGACDSGADWTGSGGCISASGASAPSPHETEFEAEVSAEGLDQMQAMHSYTQDPVLAFSTEAE